MGYSPHALREIAALVTTLAEAVRELEQIADAATSLRRLGVIRSSRGPFCSAECLGTCEQCRAIVTFESAIVNRKVPQ
jgi:hypothetical protein